MIVSAIRLLVWLSASAALGAFAALFAARIPMPGPSTPIESAIVQQALRLSSGLTPYIDGMAAGASVAPAMPAAAALGQALFGSALWTARILTLASVLSAALWLMAIVKRETMSWTYGIAGAGLLLAGYGLLGGPLGAARPEPLMWLLLLICGDSLLRGHGAHGAINAGVFLSLAALTHGAALAVGVLVITQLTARQRSQGLAFASAFAFVYGGAHVLLSLKAGPWYNYASYDATILSLGPQPMSLLRYFGQTLLGPLNVVALATFMAFALPVKPWQGPGGTWACVGGGLLLAALVLTQVRGAGPAVAMLSVMALALAGPLSMQRVTRHLAAWPGSTRVGGQSIVLTALVLQFLVLAAQLPPPRFGP
jgi:hypothetical protein